jgi:hypothetical protein
MMVNSLKSRYDWLYRGLQDSFLVGEINGRTLVPPIYVNNKKFGKSWQWPLVLEVVVKKCGFMSLKASRLSKKRLFNSDAYKGKFILNVNFSCGYHRLNEKSSYCDPLSHWFNVFLGYYQIDVPKSKWGRPFGYENSIPHSKVNGEDMHRIAKADWNYYSNYMYGVPEKKILEHNCNSLDNSDFSFFHKNDRIKIGNRYWDYAELNNFTTITAYQSEDDDELVNNSKLSPIWRDCFGLPHPRKEFSESFFPTKMKTAMYMCFDERDDLDLKEKAYSTYVFGGSINLNYPDYLTMNKKLSGNKLKEKKKELEKFNNNFLNLQLRSARKLIEDEYEHLGFKNPGKN